jgi:hypothetical protein
VSGGDSSDADLDSWYVYKDSGLRVHGSCKRYCVARSEAGLHPMAAIKLPLQDLAKGIHSPIVMGGGGSV